MFSNTTSSFALAILCLCFTNMSIAQTAPNNNDTATTSLTAGYITDEYSLATDEGSYKFRHNGELTGIMLSGRTSSLTLSYGTAKAVENEGDIRSIAADLKFGGDITLFRKFFGLPLGGFIPIRFGLGYRNLELLDARNTDSNASAHMGTGSLGAGLGAQLRIPTDLPLIEDNILARASIIKSAGGLTDFSGAAEQQDIGFQNEDHAAISGIRLTSGTDLNLEGKFENLFGNTGVTIGLTISRLNWTDEAADNFKELFDVVSGKQEGMELRSTQSFFRIGINW